MKESSLRFKNWGVGVRGFVYRLHSPGYNTCNMSKCVVKIVFFESVVIWETPQYMTGHRHKPFQITGLKIQQTLQSREMSLISK
jgi:hypothetical protein